MKRALVPLLCSAVVMGCSADVVVDGDGGAAELPPPPDVEDLAACPRLLVVPAGDAYVGYFEVSDGFEVSAVRCDDPEWPTLSAAKRLSVPGFYLDEDEVTNTCYAHCIDDGACALPPQSDDEPRWDSALLRAYPVSVTYDTAEAYCAWRGGRLPSAAELARASHGDSANVSNDVEFERMVSCWKASDPGGEACNFIRDRAHVETTPHPIRSDEADIGPFGHWDLFASRCDVTQSRFPTGEERDAYCALPEGAVDPKTYGTGSNRGFCPARGLLTTFPGSTLDNVFASTLSLGSTPGQDLFVDGVRCAFDPVGKSSR